MMRGGHAGKEQSSKLSPSEKTGRFPIDPKGTGTDSYSLMSGCILTVLRCADMAEDQFRTDNNKG